MYNDFYLDTLLENVEEKNVRRVRGLLMAFISSMKTLKKGEYSSSDYYSTTMADAQKLLDKPNMGGGLKKQLQELILDIDAFLNEMIFRRSSIKAGRKSGLERIYKNLVHAKDALKTNEGYEMDNLLESKRPLPLQKKQVLAAKQNAMRVLTKATRLQDAMDKEDDRNNGILHKAISALFSIRQNSYNIVKKTHDKTSLEVNLTNIKRYYNEVRQIIDKLNIEFKYRRMLGDLEKEMEKVDKSLRSQHNYMDPKPQEENENLLNNITNKGDNKMALLTLQDIDDIVEAVILRETKNNTHKPHSYRGDYKQMHKTETDAVQSLKGKEFVITGKFSGAKRADVIAAIKEKGGRVAGAVTRNTYAVLLGNDGSPLWTDKDQGGTKIKAADKYGIKKFHIQAFIKKTGLEIAGLK